MIVSLAVAVLLAPRQEGDTPLPAEKAAPPAALPAGPPPYVFSEVAKASGVDFVMECGEATKPRLVDQIGCGMAWFDYDGDGRLDLFCANGSYLAAWQGKEKSPRTHRLYRNLGDGKFEDVSVKAGVASNHWGCGVAVGDIDNDGDSDLYVACCGFNLLYRNQGDGTFAEEAGRAAVAFDGVTPGATFGDVDLDGDLDLYVSAYLEFDLANPPKAFGRKVRNMDISLAPNHHKGAPDKLFTNVGGGKFADTTKKSGLLTDEEEHGFTILILDCTGDDLPDVFVANDRTPNLFYRGTKSGRFEEVSDECGLAVSREGKEQACMGIGIADLNDDLLPEIMVTNFHGEYNALYMSLGGSQWEDEPRPIERAKSSRPFVGWGIGFFDLECDGDEDLLIINGHINPQFETEVPKVMEYKERPLLYRNEGGMNWTEVGELCGNALKEPHSGRASAYADYDDDGDIDVAIADVDGPIRLFRNDTPDRGHFLRVKVEGDGKRNINRDGYGARVIVEAGGKRQTRWVLGAGSYLCHNDVRAHYGLGANTKVDRITVRWPGGTEDVVQGPLDVDRTIVIHAGAGRVAEIVDGKRVEISKPAAPASGQ